ncbi:hypothetical protein SERLADRAFT_406198 [Serpula lacrymans var. lacrymans S7.9]|uniref:Uncharacterized protein n=1 Tax=Serpula lacrymans var. lacrymans (strain S7.9) TaxID=578457 RepID=F8NKL1_SERL9|nr:uncharacterized protein SERLADRAFT_406198 [Serpula lacrymans var. lacrymans S7.9]EGO28783.1 hypothetical protein SERLADRAFT_406198 [Serpula lacrymans var. lacrymans S7.9]
MSSVNVFEFASRVQGDKYTNIAFVAVIIINYIYTIAEEMLLTMIRYNATQDYHLCVYLGWAVTVILILRTYAVWGPSRTFLLGFSTFVTVITAAAVYTTVRYLRSIQCISLPVPGIIACLTLEENRLTTYKGLRHFRNATSPLWFTLFVEGVLYYFLVMASTICCVILLFLHPVEVSASIVPVTLPLMAILYQITRTDNIHQHLCVSLCWAVAASGACGIIAAQCNIYYPIWLLDKADFGN